MSVHELMPAGFTEDAAWYARIARLVRVYPQGMGGDVAIWLDIDGVSSMIGYGARDAAIAEAQAALQALSESIPGKVHELLNRA